ncbi:MAG: hypothetical protein U5N23_24230 [Acidovorax sp.]|nr:hypothetical protein [Acidovorax sp.]
MSRLPPVRWTLALVAGLVVAPVFAQVPAPSYVSGYFDRAPCVDRIGRCFDATIGGKPVQVIADKAEYTQLKALLKELNDNVREVYWIVREPVDGKVALDVLTRPNAMGLPHVGEEKEEPDVTVYELDDQGLESETEMVAQQSVRINGQPVVTQQETLTQDFLPPGRYVIAIKYLGRRNWDRKWVFLTVAQP